jgi:putative DNA primase/helicase
MRERLSDVAPPDFDAWEQWRRDEWFAQKAREYDERKASQQQEPVYRVAERSEETPPSVTLIQGSSIEPEKTDWLWEGYLAAGKVHVLGGAPGAGKTTIAIDLAATVTKGGFWPDGTIASVGNVVIWSGEDDPRDTLVPRLVAAGADRARVYFVGDVLEDGKARAFDPAKDIGPLGEAIASAGGASLLIVDPLVSAIAGDSHKNAEVRRALQPLADLAARAGAAVLGITHFSKGTAGREPTERITGSLAFGALARVVLVAAKRPAENEDDAPSRVFMRAKSNIGPDSGGFEYALRQQELERYPGVQASRVYWGSPLDGTAREILGEAETPSESDGGGVAAAIHFLRALLADGPMAASEVRANAEGAGLSWASVRRAKGAIGIQALRSGYGPGGAWEWSLPRL